MNRFHTPALSALAAGLPVEPIGYVGGRPVYPLGGGAEAVNPDPNALPSAEDLQGMTDEQVQEALDAALTEAGDLQGIDPAQMTDEQADRLTALADFADSVDTETQRRETVTSERAARIEDARRRLNPEDPAEDPEANAEDPAADPAPVEDPEAGLEEPAAVAAGGSRRTPAPRPAKRRVPQPKQEKGRALSIVAAADSGYSAGSTLESMEDVAKAFIQRSKGFPQGTARQPGVHLQHSVVSIERSFASTGDGLYDTNPDYKDAQTLLRAAADEKRLQGGSLIKARSIVAAGGWCAPSETRYDLPALETLDGIIDLPTVGITRGGINFTPGPDFADIFASAGFSQTEAQAIAGTTKACVEVDCPDFEEVRLDAVGICVKAPLLTRSAYPELVARWLAGTVVANQHKVAARLIASMRTALGTALAPTLTGTPVTWGALSIMEWVIEMQRQAYRLSEGDTLEVVAPRWLRAAIRADLANRAAVGAESVSNAQIAQHFADRGAAVQWVLNYLEVGTPLTSVAYPATAELMVYPAGTFVRGQADVINLDTVYDTADLQTNVYTAAFVEDGVLLAKMQHGGARVTIPVNVNGMMGALQLDDNLFSAQVENAGAAAV